MMTADRGIRWSTALAVLGVAAMAAASYEHAYDLERAHGESGWTARMVPLTVDGLIYASSMVMLDSARRKAPPAGHRLPPLVRADLGLPGAVMLAVGAALIAAPVQTTRLRRWPLAAPTGSARTGVSSQHTTDEAAAASGRASGSWSTA